MPGYPTKVAALLIAMQLLFSVAAQSPTISEVITAGGTGSDGSMGSTTDSNNNSIITGWITGEAQFDSMNITSNGEHDIFIAKYDSYDELIWVRQAGSTLSDLGTAIETDGNDNVIIAGTFNDSAHFGESDTLVSFGYRDAFLAKYSEHGNLNWIMAIGGPFADRAKALAIDNSNNIIYGGTFNQSTTIGYSTISGGSGRNILIAKFSENGIIKWTKSFHGIDTNEINSIRTDTVDNIYIAGSFLRALSLEDTTLQTNTRTEAFVLKLNPEGKRIWVKSFGAEEHDECDALTIDSDGNILVTGRFSQTVAFGHVTLSTPYRLNVFTAKLNANGTVLWAKPGLFNIGQSFASSLTTDALNNVYLAGQFSDSLMFEDSILTSNGDYDAFIAKYSSDGQLVWTKEFGGIGFDSVTDIQSSLNNSLVIGGQFSDNVLFGETLLSSKGNRDVFHAKLTNPTTSIENRSERIQQFTLDQNYPNPFNPVTNIKFFINRPMSVSLSVYDVGGRLVSHVLKEWLERGEHSVQWHATFNGSGIYFYQLTAGQQIETRKMILLK